MQRQHLVTLMTPLQSNCHLPHHARHTGRRRCAHRYFESTREARGPRQRARCHDQMRRYRRRHRAGCESFILTEIPIYATITTVATRGRHRRLSQSHHSVGKFTIEAQLCGLLRKFGVWHRRRALRAALAAMHDCGREGSTNTHVYKCV